MSFIRNLFHKKDNPIEEEEMEPELIEDLNGDAQKKEEVPFYRYGLEQEEETVKEDGKEYEIVEKEILPAKIICPDCGGITLEGLDFCDKCGGEL